MSLEAKASATDPDVINVHLPPTRPDILHECDVMEDAAVAYGFNNLPDIFPRTNTIAQMQAISQVSDVIRKEWALAGWIEVLPLLLVSTSPPDVFRRCLLFVSVLMKRILSSLIERMMAPQRRK
jgi:phenylalanyl-tRNA synthetase beta chain